MPQYLLRSKNLTGNQGRTVGTSASSDMSTSSSSASYNRYTFPGGRYYFNDWGGDAFDGYGNWTLETSDGQKMAIPLGTGLPVNTLYTNSFTFAGASWQVTYGFAARGIFRLDVRQVSGTPVQFRLVLGGNWGSDGGEYYSYYKRTFVGQLSGKVRTIWYKMHDDNSSDPKVWQYFIPYDADASNNQTYTHYYSGDNEYVTTIWCYKGINFYMSKDNDVIDWIINDLQEVADTAPLIKNASVTPSIHKGNVTVSATVDHLTTGTDVQYRILINGVQKYPTSEWTALAKTPYNFSQSFDYSLFNLGSNNVRIEVKDKYGAVDQYDYTVTKSNSIPTIFWSLSQSIVHREDVTASGTINDSNSDDKIKFRVLVGSTVVQDWSDWQSVPYNFSVTVPNSMLALGNNTVKIEYQDDYSSGVLSSIATVTKSNTNPTATINVSPANVHKDNVKVSGTISDANVGDMISYRLLVGSTVVQDWSPFVPAPVLYDFDVDNSYFTQLSNTVKLEFKDDFEGAVQSVTATVNLTKSDPSCSLSASPNVHLENAVINISINDADGDKCQFRVLLNGVQLYDWTSFSSVPIQTTVIVLNNVLNNGSNTITVEVKDDYKIVGTASSTITINKVNNPPVLADFKVVGNVLSGTITEPDGDMFRYRILLNGSKIYPDDNDYSPWQKYPTNVWYVIPKNVYVPGTSYTLSVDAVDQLGLSSRIDVGAVLKYAGLMFCDVDENYYSNDIGEVIKYLNVGTIVAGNNSPVYQVWIKNTLGYPLKNVELFVNQRELDGVEVKAEISKTNSPFEPAQHIVFDEPLGSGEKFTFYVRVSTTEYGEHGGKFDIIASADPM